MIYAVDTCEYITPTILYHFYPFLLNKQRPVNCIYDTIDIIIICILTVVSSCIFAT